MEFFAARRERIHASTWPGIDKLQPEMSTDERRVPDGNGGALADRYQWLALRGLKVLAP